MSILQISKIQQRSGNLVDLPQLDEAEFGWASDTKRLFIGKTTPNENVEILTGYSKIAYSQIDGSVGNLNINPLTLENGQVLTYDGSYWVNRGGNAAGLVTLGEAGNVKITGGAIGYSLQTDGTGNLSWGPAGFLYSNIANLTPDSSNSLGILANAIVMKVANTIPYVNGTAVTITGVNGVSNASINSQTFYIKLANDFPTSGNTILFNTSDLANANAYANGTLTYTNSPNAIATASSSGGGGTSAAGGSNTSVQYNNGGVSAGDSNFTWNTGVSPKLLNINGNANVGNLNATGVGTASRFISNVATGTAPLTVTSTTQVANLNVATAGLATFATTANAVAGANVSGAVSFATTANAVAGANVSGAVAYATTANAVAGANVSGAVSFATTANAVAGANVSGAVGLATFATTANAVAGANVSGAVAFATTANAVAGANVSGTVANANYSAYAANITGATQSNITTLNGLTTINAGATSTVLTFTGNLQLSAGSRLTATYADLAEYYEADNEYEPGTVLEFGGENEVTIGTDKTTKVAGVVSSNPAYVMNSECKGIAVAIALQGRVPCKVRGIIKKGDMMISGGNGYARPEQFPVMGTVIGKALQDFDGIDGIIEVAVSRH